MGLLTMGCNDKPNSELGHNEESTAAENMKGEEGAHSEGGENHEEEEGVVVLTNDQIETIGLETKILEKRNF